MQVPEQRFVRNHHVRTDAGTDRTISGYANAFGVVTDVGGDFLEQTKRGCFARAIREKQDCRCLVNHDPSLVLGSVRNGTLTLSEDTYGLRFRCDVARTSAGDDLLALLKRGDIHECSFGFSVAKDSWSRAKDSTGIMRDLRTIEDVDLFDVSAVTYPQYTNTSVSADIAMAAGVGRMSVLFPSGQAPMGMPVELRSRITAALQQGELDPIELSLRLRATTWLEQFQQ